MGKWEEMKGMNKWEEMKDIGAFWEVFGSQCLGSVKCVPEGYTIDDDRHILMKWPVDNYEYNLHALKRLIGDRKFWVRRYPLEQNKYSSVDGIFWDRPCRVVRLFLIDEEPAEAVDEMPEKLTIGGYGFSGPAMEALANGQGFLLRRCEEMRKELNQVKKDVDVLNNDVASATRFARCWKDDVAARWKDVAVAYQEVAREREDQEAFRRCSHSSDGRTEE